ncbi:MAG: amidohydrolase family protein [Pseudomonadales bacterium]
MANRFDYRGGEHEAWLEQVQEAILDPHLPIVDAHHHLWIRDQAPYLLREFAADLQTGHHIVASVFAECHSMYRATGAEAERPLGEMEFIAGVAAMSDSGAFGTTGVCRAAVGNVDLSLGDAVEPLLERMTAVSGGRFRGVRASICWDASDALHRAAPRAGYLGEPAVRAGIAALERLGLSLDCWLYHPQIPELTAVADGYPALTIILNHTGTPILGGPYRDRQDEVRARWLADMRELARRPNVFVKLGALPARFRPAGADRARPPGSQAVAAAWGPWILPCIEMFGARRCMFESNFPVHKNWMSYPVLWNAFKRMSADASVDERQALFAGTAARAYRLTGVAAVS